MAEAIRDQDDTATVKDYFLVAKIQLRYSVKMENDGITKQDLVMLQQSIQRSLAETEERLKRDSAEAEERLKGYVREKVEEIETKLLRAFHGWARSMEVRTRGTAVLTAGLDERMSYIEERVSDLERKQSR